MKEVEKEKHEQGRTDEQENTKSAPVSETWAQETIEDLDDFIESQGIYIRQCSRRMCTVRCSLDRWRDSRTSRTYARRRL